MAESSLQENNLLSDEELQIPYAAEEQGRRWDMNVNNAILFGVTALVLAKVALIDSDVSRGWTAAEVVQHMPMSVWQAYMGVLTDAPIATKAVTSATVYTIGDVIAQQTEGTSIDELDRMRTLRSMLAGLIGHGPLSHMWYNVSENLFDHVLHWTAWWSFIPKVAIDQAFWGPIWNNTYLLLLGLMKGESLGQIWGDVKRTTIPLVVSGLKLWPLAHCVTYGLIPIENRLLWVDLVEIIWVTVLATSAAEASGAHGLAAPEAEDEKFIIKEEDPAYITQ
jgi:protein Mpv17